ncbi:hypothetical protein [Gordonia sputi]|uniref:Uncharacterized protein n=1 Tax=Gordonia sputi NBRC 100414 TaxID=1089453 RepID=H5U6Y3_9ACTN|nr:hypothetical protein A5766_07930 [Gordonia sp. 852002-51296_SCH5728562-b]GAB41491.1 hypothetical protein GOSPT_131_00260 [Gordonia sputi NBRC 100414]
MNSYPDAQKVVDDLGDKLLGAFIQSVDGAAVDLEAFRDAFPTWFVNFSKRFVANFVHERMWDRMVREVADESAVQIIDQEPTRQILIDRYVIRFKRHRSDLKISTYPTSGALAFWTNVAMIPGTETHSLALGYLWDVDEAAVKGALLSYRTELDRPLWSVSLGANPIQAAGSGPAPIDWTPLEPNLPQLDLRDIIEEDEDGTEGGS